MDLRQLEILQAIADTGSFTACGRKLHVSQSAISRQIALLEEELGEPLFLRVGRHVRMTPAAESLVKLGQRVFQDVRDTVGAITDRTRALARHAASRRRHDGLSLRVAAAPQAHEARASAAGHPADRRDRCPVGGRDPRRTCRRRAAHAADRRVRPDHRSGPARGAAARHAAQSSAREEASDRRRRIWPANRSCSSKPGRPRGA